MNESKALHLCKHGIAEEIVNKPDNKAEKFEKDTVKKPKNVKTGKVVMGKPKLTEKKVIRMKK
jgi:hypothetical protein